MPLSYGLIPNFSHSRAGGNPWCNEALELIDPRVREDDELNLVPIGSDTASENTLFGKPC